MPWYTDANIKMQHVSHTNMLVAQRFSLLGQIEITLCILEPHLACMWAVSFTTFQIARLYLEWVK